MGIARQFFLKVWEDNTTFVHERTENFGGCDSRARKVGIRFCIAWLEKKSLNFKYWFETYFPQFLQC